MKTILSAISYLSLALLTLPSVLYLAGSISLASVKVMMVIATVIWYVVTPLWMEHGKG